MSKYEIKKWFWELIFQVVGCRHRRKANLNTSIRSLIYFFLLRLDKRKNINFVQKAFYSGSRGLFGGNKAKRLTIATFDVMRFFHNMSKFENPINNVATDHPITFQLVHTREKVVQLMISNYTTSEYNAIKIAEKGELHETSEVYIHNDFSLISLNERVQKLMFWIN